MKNNASQSRVQTVLQNKIILEENTLALLKETEPFADDINQHSQMILMQQRVVDFYKTILAKVNTTTFLH